MNATLRFFLGLTLAASVALGGSAVFQAAQAESDSARNAAIAQERDAALRQAYDQGYADAMAAQEAM